MEGEGEDNNGEDEFGDFDNEMDEEVNIINYIADIDIDSEYLY